MLRNETREFIEFFFEVIWAAKQILKNPKVIDSQKNIAYSSKHLNMLNSSEDSSKYQNSLGDFNSTSKMMRRKSMIERKKLELKLFERRLSQNDIADILWNTANSFRNINISMDFFRTFVKNDFINFKNQIKQYLDNSNMQDTHQSEIEMIYHQLDQMGEEFELDYKSFYYYFKMNSFFAKWKVFDYEIFKKRCKSF
jgi:hypothetical protein